ncbi:PREDICTED: protein TALPID3-like [Cyprinodon variegatus]|uniref:protein TALPID3-like n=1 Tax=Cyprinodon variegatus TaxID=28743 RepID=UPI000742A633|nr:PREDICTED: protein TALPID3-like [Cyprinodon variegatus]
MSRLSESVQKLLETNREADGRRWGLSQQTLHHLETLQSQQLQLQSQLMESAIKIVTGHSSMTSDSEAAAKVGHQKPVRPDSTAEMDAVTMETGPRGSRPGQTRDNLCVQTPLAESLHLQSLANDTQEAVRRASDMLKQMESLKTEIKMLLTQQEQTPQFSFPAPDQSEIPNKHLEPQQSKSKPKQAWFYLSSAEQSQSRPNDLQQHDSQNTSHVQHNKQHVGQQLQSQLNPPSSRDLQPVPTPSQAGPSLTHPSFTQESRGLSNQRSHPGLVQRKPRSHSVLEEAGQVLRQARRRKKVLEENLEALMKAKNGEILHCQLEALAANR